MNKTKLLENTTINFIAVASYNQATAKLAFHSNETSKDKLLIIKLAIDCYHRLIHIILPNYSKTCSFLHAHYNEVEKFVKNLLYGKKTLIY